MVRGVVADDSKAILEKIQDAAHKRYGRNRARLAQLDAALATTKMALDALEDEEGRHSDLAARVRAANMAGLESPHRLQLANMHPEYAKEGN